MTLAAILRTTAAVLIVALATSSAVAQSPPQVPSSPQAQPQSEEAIRARAKQLFEAAVVDFDAGRYAPALVGFQEAFRIRPHPLVRVNMANCYDKLGKPLQAIFHFEQFLQADVGTPEQRKEVVTAVARLNKQVGQVLLRVAPDGATVIIDGGEQRRAPVLDPVRLPVGKHAIEVQLAGYKTVRRGFVVEEGAAFELNVALEPGSGGAALAAPVPVPATSPVMQVIPSDTAPVAGEAPSPAPERHAPPTLHASEAPAERAARVASHEPAPKPSNGHALPTSVWIVGGVSAALLVGGTVTGILALGAESDFQEQSDQYKALVAAPAGTFTPLQRLAVYDKAAESADRTNTLALTTDILLGGALVGAAVTTVLVVMHLQEPEQPSVTATLTRKSAGLQLRASF